MSDVATSGAQLDAFAALEGMSGRVFRFLRTHFGVDSGSRLEQALQRWTRESGGLLSEPLIEGSLPPRRGPTLQELEREGVLHAKTVELLDVSGAFPASRPLWEHQAEALRAAESLRHDGRHGAVVVSAGTGAGKTECFSVPVLDALVRDHVEDALDVGLRTIIIYPLNALVMDQVGRWRAVLRVQEQVLGCHAIRFGLYTSRLPEDRTRARRVAAERERFLETLSEADRIRATPLDPRSEIAHREQLRAEPPHVLITNYTMLEYALIRPKDDALFQLSGGKLRSVVLDEAHTYRAGMAAEIALLLRRLALRLGVTPGAFVGFATSATFGESGPEALRSFTADLFSQEAPDGVAVVVARPGKIPLAAPADREGDVGPDVTQWAPEAVERAHRALSVADMAGDADGDGPASELRQALAALGLVPPAPARELVSELYDALRASGAFAEMVEQLEQREGLCAMPELAGRLDHRAAALLLRLAATARKDHGRPLLPVRLHTVVQGAGAINVCSNPSCSGRPEQPVIDEVPLGSLSFSRRASCEHCGAPLLHLAACRRCGARMLTGVARHDVDTDSERLLKVEPLSTRALDDESLRRVLLATSDDPPGQGWRVQQQLSVAADGTLVPGDGPLWELVMGEGGEGVLDPLQRGCPMCGDRRFEPVRVSVELLRLSVLEALYEHLPPGQRDLPGRGRRLLSFSDSRQAAARLAPHFAFTHSVQLFRAMVARLLDRESADPELQRMKETMQLFREQGDVDLAAQIEARLAQMEQRRSRPTVSVGQLPRLLQQELSGADRQLLAASRVRIDVQPDHRAEGEAERQLLAVHATRELARVAVHNNSAETLGLADVGYPGLDLIPDERLGELSGLTGLNDNETRTLLAALLDTVRRQGAVDPLPGVQFREPDFGGGVLGKWVCRESARGASRDDSDDDRDFERDIKVHSFVPNNLALSGRANLVRRVLARQGRPTDDDGVRQVLCCAFDLLASVAGPDCRGIALRNSDLGPEIQVELARCTVRQPRRVLRCRSCGARTSRELRVCPAAGCEGEVEQVHHVDNGLLRAHLGHDHYVYNAFEMELSAPRCVEHTAQLQAEDLELLEIGFRKGEVNLLSASTTLELGIDIGELQAVVLNTLPPTPSSYIQRAGRAGRRDQGTALALTFSRGDPADQWAFADLRGYIERRQPPPRVHLSTERIARRHLNAWVLATFFTAAGWRHTGGPLLAWGKVGQFFLDTLEPRVQHDLAPLHAGSNNDTPLTAAELCLRWLDDATGQVTPAQLRGLRRLARATVFADRDPAELLADLATSLVEDVGRIQRDVVQHHDRIASEQAQARRDGKNRYAEMLGHRINDLHREELVARLAREEVLPSYGFPIDVVRLDVRNAPRPEGRRQQRRYEARYRMERSGPQAIREYAPGAELVVDGHIYQVAGLSRHDSRTFHDQPPQYLLLQICRHCSSVEKAPEDERPADTCSRCGSTSIQLKEVVVPRGMATDPHATPGRAGRRPERPVRSQFYQDVGSQPQGDPPVELVPGIRSRYLRRLSLFALNLGTRDRGYWVCRGCLRARPADLRGEAPPTHPALLANKSRRGAAPRCSSSYGHYWIGHSYISEGLQLDFEQLPQPGAAVPGEAGELLPSLGQALRLAAALLLEVDIRELAEIHWQQDDGRATVTLFDERPGGSGYLPLLAGPQAGLGLLRQALALARHEGIDPELTDRCQQVCPTCLLTMDARHLAPVLDRRLVVDALEACDLP